MKLDSIDVDAAINDAKRHWLHGVSNEAWTHYYPHARRGKLAMDEMGIFCRVRGYLSTCRKQNISASDAMRHVFEGSLPVFQK